MRLQLARAEQSILGPETYGLTFTFEIAVGVRHADRELLSELDTILKRRKGDVARVLTEYGVPLR